MSDEHFVLHSLRLPSMQGIYSVEGRALRLKFVYVDGESRQPVEREVPLDIPPESIFYGWQVELLSIKEDR